MNKPSLLAALHEATTFELEVGRTDETPGIWVRLRPVTTEGLMRYRLTVFAAISSVQDLAPDLEPAQLTPEQTPEFLEQTGVLARTGRACACACVSAIAPSKDGPWEACELVPEHTEADPAKGRLWVGSLTDAACVEIMRAVIERSNENGRLAKAAASFRG